MKQAWVSVLSRRHRCPVAGNVEYFIHMKAGMADMLGDELEKAVREAVASGAAGADFAARQ